MSLRLNRYSTNDVHTFCLDEQLVRHILFLTSQLTVIVLKREHVTSAIIFVSYNNNHNICCRFFFFCESAETLEFWSCLEENTSPLQTSAWLTLFKKITAVYSENHTKLINKSRSYRLLKQVVHNAKYPTSHGTRHDGTPHGGAHTTLMFRNVFPAFCRSCIYTYLNC
jgi:hypothetical protein